ncbi:Probable Co/Zn/Cd efflux system membrane fusion protein [hydrothermal vent metagenome]|uniref:Probable Co/Zn/Cd efflux system membrane fusion protein n=1 Tax=hydrothermal vent metagenome TaxID=652676 RepID=A0A3B0X214_9ZZZZ
MKQFRQLYGFMPYVSLFLCSLVVACGTEDTAKKHANKHTHGALKKAQEVVKGPHGGRLLQNGDFALELSIFETGVPPEFRAQATQNGERLKPEEVELEISLTRLNANGSAGGNEKIDKIKFSPYGDVMRGDRVIYEPHSFVVTINAVYQGKKYFWKYDNFEGRTKIENEVASALGVKTLIAAPAVLHETVNVYGQIVVNTDWVRNITARFPGLIRSVAVSIGDIVQKDQALAIIESNESFNQYSVTAPISGVITQRNANPGEHTDNRQLFTIMDTSKVWVDLSIFPNDRHRVRTGAQVSLEMPGEDINSHTQQVKGRIKSINVTARPDQTVVARMEAGNKKGRLVPGSFIKARIAVADHAVPLAVKRSGLQPFRDFTVVYVKVGEQYEVRMLELGRQDREWAEVLGGLMPGARYVSENSYVIKADIEKSGASHDH